MFSAYGRQLIVLVFLLCLPSEWLKWKYMIKYEPSHLLTVRYMFYLPLSYLLRKNVKLYVLKKHVDTGLLVYKDLVNFCDLCNSNI